MLPQIPNTILHPGEFHASQRQQKQSNRTRYAQGIENLRAQWHVMMTVDDVKETLYKKRLTFR